MISMFYERALREGVARKEIWPKIQTVPFQETINAEWLKRSFEAFYNGAGLEESAVAKAKTSLQILQNTQYENLLSRILIGDRGVIFLARLFLN